ncbi:3-dehydroquinate synthase [Colwelliaceae bacterium 6471]
MTTLSASFSVPYQFSVTFVDNLFDDEDGAQKIFSNIQDNAAILPVIEQELLHYHPDLVEQITLLISQYSLVPVSSLILPGGETGKNTPEIVTQVIDSCIEHQIDRHSYILAIGGGAFIDMVGYAATITHRGIRLIRMPTTVLAQNDAGVGVKNAINYQGRKNFLGTFSPPYAVVNSYQFITSLPKKEKRAGIAEAIKVALIKDEVFFDDLYIHRHELSEFHPPVMKRMIKECARLHMQHICENGDPFELGSARPLDFGHWSAHALEELSSFQLRHGEAVAIGILIDAKYSYLQGWLNANELSKVEQLILELQFPVCINTLMKLDIQQSLDNFRAHLGGQLCITMLQGIGHCHEVNQIDILLMQQAIDQLVGKVTAVV